MEHILEVHNLAVSYGDKVIFKDLNFTLDRGQFVALTGSNGSGKSTLLKAILKIVSYSGHIHSKFSSIGYLPQSYSIDRSFPITVEEFIELARSIKSPTLSSSSDNELKNNNTDLNTDVFQKAQIANLKNSYLNELSQGQFQKVLFARSIVNKPELLILDEPLSNIDEETALYLKELLLEMNRQGVTILLSIHDSKFVSENCSQILSLGNKNIVMVDQCFHNHESTEQ